MMPWISSDTLKHPLINGLDTVYALANPYDPFISKRLNDTAVDLQMGNLAFIISQ